MVVSYLMSPITWWLVKKMVSIRWASLPNLLANEELVPEFLQEKARPDDLAVAVNKALDEKQSDALIKRFEELHLLLKQSADQQAASAVLELALQ